MKEFFVVLTIVYNVSLLGNLIGYNILHHSYDFYINPQTLFFAILVVIETKTRISVIDIRTLREPQADMPICFDILVLLHFKHTR